MVVQTGSRMVVGIYFEGKMKPYHHHEQFKDSTAIETELGD